MLVIIQHYSGQKAVERIHKKITKNMMMTIIAIIKNYAFIILFIF